MQTYFNLVRITAAMIVVTPGVLAAQSTTTGARAFAIEAAGGSIGSVAGAALGLAISRPDKCETEDLSCEIRALGVAGVTSAVGAAAGAVFAGRKSNTRPSTVGAIAGSIAGAVAGVAVIHGLTEEANLRLEKPAILLAYSVTQGIVTAIGSRLIASMR
jgi:hypothetical protein